MVFYFQVVMSGLERSIADYSGLAQPKDPKHDDCPSFRLNFLPRRYESPAKSDEEPGYASRMIGELSQVAQDIKGALRDIIYRG